MFVNCAAGGTLRGVYKCTIVAGAGQRYLYTDHLKELNSKRPEGTGTETLPAAMCEVRTPLIWQEWERALTAHPDKEFCEYVIQGLRQGFRVGFQHSAQSCARAKSNMKSASDNPGEVDRYIEKEVRLGRVVGPSNPEELPEVQISRFGVIPKNHQPGKWRLIVDLSHPEGQSVNDGIDRELCSMRYTTVEGAVRRVQARGRRAQLAKLDVESAYRIVPIHPEDRQLLGMEWKGNLYVDTALPFGLRSAPKIFNALADALQWILEQAGVEVIHYLDDFLLFGAPESSEGREALRKTLEICANLGIPIASHKTEGPSTVLVFLGIELDTDRLTLRLPREKLCRLKKEIRRWKGRKACTKRELLSLIGQLQHASCVVRPGRTFLRRMINLSKTARRPHHNIRLNKGFRSDLQWWATFLPAWNGVSMMGGGARSRCAATITSDASGSWGCGAFSSVGEWFQIEWSEGWKEFHITVKELLPIVVGVALWGAQWSGKAVRCLCDNAAVVAVVNSGSSKCENVMHLLRSLFFFTASYDVVLVAQHIPGVENGAADALSRGNLPSFHAQEPAAQQTTSPIPQELLEALVHQRPDWTSQNWTALLVNCSQKA